MQDPKIEVGPEDDTTFYGIPHVQVQASWYLKRVSARVNEKIVSPGLLEPDRFDRFGEFMSTRH